jgi:hypothetical protein
VGALAKYAIASATATLVATNPVNAATVKKAMTFVWSIECQTTANYKGVETAGQFRIRSAVHKWQLPRYRLWRVPFHAKSAIPTPAAPSASKFVIKKVWMTSANWSIDWVDPIHKSSLTTRLQKTCANGCGLYRALMLYPHAGKRLWLVATKSSSRPYELNRDNLTDFLRQNNWPIGSNRPVIPVIDFNWGLGDDPDYPYIIDDPVTSHEHPHRPQFKYEDASNPANVETGTCK